YTPIYGVDQLRLHSAYVYLATGMVGVRRTLVEARGGEPVYGEPKTSRSRRTIKLPEDAAAALRHQRARQAEQRLAAGGYAADYGLVFASQVGTPLLARNVIRAFKVALERAGLPRSIRIHDLRHYAATLMLA